ILSRSCRRKLEPVERALARQRPRRIGLVHHRRHQWVMAQMIVIIQILIPERQSERSLPDHRLQRMFDQQRVAVIAEASGELLDDASPPLGLAQQQPSTIRAELPTIELNDHLTPPQRLETELRPVTLCLFHAAASHALKVVADTQLNSMDRRLFLWRREKCGLSATAI